MSGKILATGLRAQVREAMLLHPAGATAAELAATVGGGITAKAVNAALIGMRRRGHAQAHTVGTRTEWTLDPAIAADMARARRVYAAAKANPAAARPLVEIDEHYASTITQRKDRERAVLQAQMEAFERAGGRVEVLGNTPLRRSKDYRSSQTGIAR